MEYIITFVASVAISIITAYATARFSYRFQLKENNQKRSTELYEDCLAALDDLSNNPRLALDQSFSLKVSKLLNRVAVFGNKKVLKAMKDLSDYLDLSLRAFLKEKSVKEKKYWKTNVRVDPYDNEEYELEEPTIDPEDYEMVIERLANEFIPSEADLEQRISKVVSAVNKAIGP